jgi:hypothetical protein
VALADLLVLTEMALNIAVLVATLQSGKQLSPAAAAAIQNISAEAARYLNLLEPLYNRYKASPGTERLQKIEDAIETLNTNSPALLLAAHIGSDVSGADTAAVEFDSYDCD